jgi:hypothetical protein
MNQNILLISKITENILLFFFLINTLDETTQDRICSLADLSITTENKTSVA